MNTRRTTLLAMAALTLACTDKDDTGGTDDTADTSDTDVPSDDWQRRSLFYLTTGRACMTAADGTGMAREVDPTAEPVLRYELCTTDADCSDSGYPVCAHLELSDVSDDVLEAFYPPLASPLMFTDTGGIGYRRRYVPLCPDGSGDHEYSLFGTGTAPTCAEEDYIRCTDGTRPSYSVKPGSQDSWILWAGQGGLSLFPTSITGWVHAHLSPSHLGGSVQPPSQRAGLEGIFSDSVGGVVFSDWTRVYVEKCTPDRWLGRSVQQQTADDIDCSDIFPGCEGVLDAPMSDPTYEYDLYLHGDLIVDAVLHDLEDGADLYEGYDSGSPTVATSAPPLSDAEQVLLTCWSNGCNGLHTSFDRRGDTIEAMAPGVDVRAVFNGFFAASLEGEWAIDEATDGFPVVGDRDWYDLVRTGDSISGVPISDATYDGGTQATTLDWFGAELDASCLADHVGDVAPCYDSMHVLANHLARPFFYNFAQRDNTVSDGGLVTGPYCEATALDGEYCDFTGVLTPWQQLVRKQAADLHLLAETERCEADTEGAAPYDETFMWFPNWTSHASWAADATVSYELGPDAGTTVTMRQAVYGWATGVVDKAICMELAPLVDSSASNTSLGVPICVSSN